MRAPETRASEWQSKLAFRRITSMCITAITVACQPHNLVLLYIHMCTVSQNSGSYFFLQQTFTTDVKLQPQVAPVPLFRRADCWPSDWTAVPDVRLCVFLDLPSFFFRTIDMHKMQDDRPSPPHCQHRVSALSTHDLCKSVQSTEQTQNQQCTGCP